MNNDDVRLAGALAAVDEALTRSSGYATDQSLLEVRFAIEDAFARPIYGKCVRCGGPSGNRWEWKPSCPVCDLVDAEAAVREVEISQTSSSVLMDLAATSSNAETAETVWNFWGDPTLNEQIRLKTVTDEANRLRAIAERHFKSTAGIVVADPPDPTRERLRLVFSLRSDKSMAFSEIAAVLGVSISTARKLFRHAEYRHNRGCL